MRPLLAILIILMCFPLAEGCGVAGSPEQDEGAGENRPTPVIIPVQNPLPDGSSMGSNFRQPTLGGPVDIEVLLGFLIDAQLLASLDGEPVGSPLTSLPYLERLCRELDIPDHRCRQRYGD